MWKDTLQGRSVDMDSIPFCVSTVNPQYGKPSTHTADTISVEELAELVRKDARIKAQTLRVREARKASEEAYREAKLRCLAIIPAVCAPKGTRREGVSLEHASRLYCADIDQGLGDPKLAAALIEDLKTVPHCVLAAVSVGGRDVWALLAGPKAHDWDEYKRFSRAMLSSRLSEKQCSIRISSILQNSIHYYGKCSS